MLGMNYSWSSLNSNSALWTFECIFYCISIKSSCYWFNLHSTTTAASAKTLLQSQTHRASLTKKMQSGLTGLHSFALHALAHLNDKLVLESQGIYQQQLQHLLLQGKTWYAVKIDSEQLIKRFIFYSLKNMVSESETVKCRWKWLHDIFQCIYKCICNKIVFIHISAHINYALGKVR